jgi:hypothetical protein
VLDFTENRARTRSTGEPATPGRRWRRKRQIPTSGFTDSPKKQVLKLVAEGRCNRRNVADLLGQSA